MGNNMREKNPTFTYIKEFDNFSEGFEELTKLIPSISMYVGTVPAYDNVIQYMIKIINKNIPSPWNEQYPNTLSFSISAKEVGFLTDDSLAFGWKIFINHKDNSKVFQFRVTFISLSMTKKMYIEALTSNKWKARDLVEKQSRFWNEATGSHRPVSKARSINRGVPDNGPKRSPERSDILVEERRNNTELNDSSISSGKDTTRQDDINHNELDGKDETAKETQKSRPVETPKPIVKAVKPKIQTKKLDQPMQTIKVESDTLEQNIEMNKIKTQATCSIVKGPTAAQFTITHKGVTRNININDNNEDILLNRACHTLMIENVVYNYDNCQVTVLDDSYKPEQAIALGCSNGSGLTLPDTAFVGNKAKAEYLAETTASTGNVIIPKKVADSPAKKAFIIDKAKPVTKQFR
jgi:hypothetical protein